MKNPMRRKHMFDLRFPIRLVSYMVIGAFLMFANIVMAAPLTDAEKRLLQGSITSAAAEMMGNHGDAAGLKRIVLLGDDSLVYRFGGGMSLAGIRVMPADVEEVVAANFNHPTLGIAFRAFSAKYQTRKMFDLHHARVQIAFRANEPSLKQILNTDLAGIDAIVLELAKKYPSELGNPNVAALFLGDRKYLPAVPMLIATMPHGYSQAADRLQAYASVEVWKSTREGVEMLHRAGKILPELYDDGAKRFDRLIANSKEMLALEDRRERVAAYERKLKMVQPAYEYIVMLSKSDPRRFAEELARYLDKVEPLAVEAADSTGTVMSYLKRNYFTLGMTLRFQLGNPDAAIAPFTKAAEHGQWMGLIAVADTYQFGLGDRGKAATAYQRALDDRRMHSGSHGDQRVWYRSWLVNEIRFLKEGKVRSVSMTETAVGGFFDALSFSGSPFNQTYGFDEVMTEMPEYRWFAVGIKRWSDLEAEVAKLDRASLLRKLDAIPASRLALRAAIKPISLLPDPESILRQLRKHDPSGIWTAPLLGAVLAVARGGDPGKAGALLNGIATTMPGLAAAGLPPPLIVAATRFMEEQKLRLVPPTLAN